MILHELKSFDLIAYETRSMKREIKSADKSYRIEKLMLKFLNKTDFPLIQKKREKLWEAYSAEIDELRNDIFEQQLLKIFDFTAWIESKIRKFPLGEVINLRLM
jgi:hypothetical protein